MNINWKKEESGAYTGHDANGNIYKTPANQETCTCILKDGGTGCGWTPEEACEAAKVVAASREINTL